MAVFALALAVSGAARVASLDLCADEYLLLLARPGQVAAVSRLSQDPAESPLWRAARRHSTHRGRIEELIPLRPRLLIATGQAGGRATADIAAKMGMRTLVLQFPASPADVVANLRKLAAALGDPGRAEPFARRFRHIAAPPVRQRDAIFLAAGGQSFAPGSLEARWMALGGLRQRSLAGGRATLETLAVRPPQVLLTSTYRSGQMSLGQRWLDHPLVRRSVSRRIATDGRRWTCAGPLMIEEIERLRGLG